MDPFLRTDESRVLKLMLSSFSHDKIFGLIQSNIVGLVFRNLGQPFFLVLLIGFCIGRVAGYICF